MKLKITHMHKKLNINIIKKEFKDKGFVIEDEYYNNINQSFNYICSNGHRHKMRLDHLRQGIGCPYCNKRPSLCLIKEELKKENYFILSNEYKDVNTILVCKCCNNHIFKTTWRYWKKGRRCFECNKYYKIKDSFFNIKNKFLNDDYIIISNNYTNNHSKLKYICPNGHIGSIRVDHFLSGHRCHKCFNIKNNENNRYTLDFVLEALKKENYSLLTNRYINAKQKLECVCPNGHPYITRWNNWQQGHRCPKCANLGVSKQEKNLFEQIKYLYNGEIIRNDRTLISPYELDIVIPDKKIAIEYCGLYWHSQLAGKNQNYHLNKLIMCKQKNYKLITIFADEFENKNSLVMDYLARILKYDLYEDIDFNKCKIYKVNKLIAYKFCEDNNIKNYTSFLGINLGAYYNEELIALMVFSEQDNDVYELCCFCLKSGYRIDNIEYILLNYFVKNINYKYIYVNVDRRWSDGIIYKKLGFSLDQIYVPKYFFVQDNRRVEGFLDNNNEQSIYNKIWDCGYLKFILFNSKNNYI